MPKFTYKAKQGPDKSVEGEIFAETEASALSKLEGMGYVPVWVREQGLESHDGGGRAALKRVTRRDLNIFTRQLAGLIRAGVPILKALRTVKEQSSNKRLQLTVEKLAASVRDGRTLSDALSAHPRLFSELYVNMIRSGESGGVLDVILMQLADAGEKEEEVRRKVQSAVAYPALVLLVGAATVFTMLVFFLPKITKLFENFQDLPLPTRVLLKMSDLCSDYWHVALLPLILLGLILARLTSGGAGRTVIDRLKLSLPVVGRLIKEASIARFARTLSLLIRAGIPVEKGLTLSAETLNNSVLKTSIEGVKERIVQHGSSIAAGLERDQFFPVFVRNMVAVGEEGGSLEEALAEAAQFYEKEVEARISTITSLIEPMLILVVGGAVGFIVFAMLLPIFDITTRMR